MYFFTDLDLVTWVRPQAYQTDPEVSDNTGGMLRLVFGHQATLVTLLGTVAIACSASAQGAEWSESAGEQPTLVLVSREISRIWYGSNPPRAGCSSSVAPVAEQAVRRHP